MSPKDGVAGAIASGRSDAHAGAFAVAQIFSQQHVLRFVNHRAVRCSTRNL